MGCACGLKLMGGRRTIRNKSRKLKKSRTLRKTRSVRSRRK